ncbi:MAG: hypothetical protein K2K82_07770 [Muribaculaceae bacterium]|nr:hypothetical protein [Muribaculaceae bacterium]
MAKLSRDKVRAMLPKDCIFIPCDNAAEVESVYQTAIQSRKEMEEEGLKVIPEVSKSQKTLSVVVRTGIN